jgi:predicted esterase
MKRSEKNRVENVASSRKAKWIGCLLVVCALSSPALVAAQEPVKVQATQRSFNEAYNQQDWTRAIDLGLELVKMVPDRPLPQYNLACVYALKGDTTASLQWLGRAAATGFDGLSHLDSDDDLDAIRDQKGFVKVRSVIAGNRWRREGEIRRVVEASPPLVVPPKDHDPQSPAPLIIALHGYGDRAEGYPSKWRGAAAKAGAILAVPQGVRRVGNGFYWGNVDEANTILALTIDYVRQSYAVDDERIVLTGFSQGGFMAMALGVRNRDLLIGVIPMAGGYLPEIDSPPPVEGGDPRYYFMVGARDRNVPEVKMAAKDFKTAGYRVKLRVYPEAGHTFPRRYDFELWRALRFVLED